MLYDHGQKEGEVMTLLKTGAPGAIPTRDLPLRSRIHEPFVFNSYENHNKNACACVAYCA